MLKLYTPFIAILLCGAACADEAWRQHAGKVGPDGQRCPVINPDPELTRYSNVDLALEKLRNPDYPGIAPSVRDGEVRLPEGVENFTMDGKRFEDTNALDLNSGHYQFQWRSTMIATQTEHRLNTEPRQGFSKVFNGTDLSGWDGGDEWSVEDGALTGVADGTLKSNRFIVWQGEALKNFELQVMVRVSEAGNSGLQYRGKVRPDLGPHRVSGYQCDVVAKNPSYNGMLYEEKGRRILARHGNTVVIDTDGQPWITESKPVVDFKPNQWHQYRILAKGNHLQHWIDGQKTVDVIDLDESGRALEGVLAVQVHVGPPMKIQFKDFFLKRLPDDLPLIESENFKIPDGAIQVKPQGRLPRNWKPVTYADREKIGKQSPKNP